MSLNIKGEYMKILYSGNYCGSDYLSHINETHDYSNATAQEKVEGIILEGLNMQNNIDITAISSVQVTSYPKHRKLFWPLRFNNKNNLSLIHIPFINILVIKQLIIMFSSFIFALTWFLRNWRQRDKVFLSYSTNIPVVLPCILLSKIFSTKSVIIVSEIPKHRIFRGQESNLRKILLNFWITTATKLHNWFDGYVVLTDAMNEEINLKEKPSIRIEGMVRKEQEIEFSERKTKKFTGDNQIFLYSGTLDEKYGIDTLLSAFTGIKDQNLNLWIVGSGENEEELRKTYEGDKRIKFFGRINNSQVTEMQKQVHFLLNPRPTSEEFTKYSFPSKTLEYMVSGTPTITTKLSGIPLDYNQYLLFFEDESVLGIRNTLIQMTNLSIEKQILIGNKARSFVLTNKNNSTQCRKIIEMLKTLVVTVE